MIKCRVEGITEAVKQCFGEEDAALRAQRYDEYAKLNRNFHSAIWDLTGN